MQVVHKLALSHTGTYAFCVHGIRLLLFASPGGATFLNDGGSERN
jgi:hypothetical protein